uniref:(northern house mosquito) hypothetical protein n=1 Tax=Culex pipiens TaxID=7175 RepID=A0A8D8AFX0_CULPI
MTSWDHHHQLIGRIRYRFRRTVASRQPHGNHYNHPCRNWDVIYQHYQSGTCTVRMRPRGQSLIWARSAGQDFIYHRRRIGNRRTYPRVMGSGFDHARLLI